MVHNKSPHLKLATPISKEEQKAKAKKRRWRIFKKRFSSFAILCLVLLSTYLVMTNRTYSSTTMLSIFPREYTGSSSFDVFRRGFIRFNRDGISYVNRRNQEEWVHPLSMQNPRLSIMGNSVAVADIGGNQIFVFQETGLIGGFNTRFPIERFSVSGQGIVSVILRDENRPKIITYDATGNILVENHASFSTYGYPTALHMSKDGLVLGTSFLTLGANGLNSRVVYYNFGAAGDEVPNREVTIEEFPHHIVADMISLGMNTKVAISDTSFILFEGRHVPSLVREVFVSNDIRRVFHSDTHLGFLVMDHVTGNYQIRLYNRSGELVMTHELTSDFGNIRINGSQIMMFEHNRFIIMSTTGVIRYEGEVEGMIQMIHPAGGINGFFIMTEHELQVVYLL